MWIPKYADERPYAGLTLLVISFTADGETNFSKFAFLASAPPLDEVVGFTSFLR